MRYRKKPLEIEAWRYGEEATPEWGHVAFESGVLRLTPDGEAKVRTLEGSMTARKGDYIVKGIKGELYPVKPDIFEATYGSVDAQKDWRAAVTEANDLPERRDRLGGGWRHGGAGVPLRAHPVRRRRAWQRRGLDDHGDGR